MLDQKSSEASQADIHLAALRLAHLLHKFFHNGRNRYGLDTRFTGNLLYYFRFRHIRTSFVRNSILLPRLSTIQYDNIGSMTGLLTKKPGFIVFRPFYRPVSSATSLRIHPGTDDS